MEHEQTIPILDAAELRVLGSLMEKSKTTPDYYPMTVNSLVAACNQKTSRKPVVDYDEDTVATALNTLKKKGLVATATGGTSRTIKYRHTFAVAFPLLPAEVTLICLLILRGAQTPGELNTNSGRMHEFDDLEEILTILEKLSEGDNQFVKQLPRKPGQKEVRYTHLLGGNNLIEDDETEIFSSKNLALETRVSVLEEQLKELKEAFDKLMNELS